MEDAKKQLKNQSEEKRKDGDDGDGIEVLLKSQNKDRTGKEIHLERRCQRDKNVCRLGEDNR